jgi:predicted RNase H-like HicB family nuclease
MKAGQEGWVPEYLVIGFPHQSGTWAAVFPDFVGVTGRGGDLAQAIDRASEGAVAVIQILTKIGAPLPLPKDLRQIQQDHVWTGEYGIVWSCAVVSTVALQSQLAVEPAPAHARRRRPSRSVVSAGMEPRARLPAPVLGSAVVALAPGQEMQRAEAHV